MRPVLLAAQLVKTTTVVVGGIAVTPLRVDRVLPWCLYTWTCGTVAVQSLEMGSEPSLAHVIGRIRQTIPSVTATNITLSYKFLYNGSKDDNQISG